MSSEIELVYHISEAFNQLGWSLILNLAIYYYPEVVHEFYANIVNKTCHNEELVELWMRGKHIYLTTECLATILGCSNQGWALDLKKGFVTPNRW